MITCVTYDNLEITGKAFSSQFKLRHKSFIQRLSYDVKAYKDQEYDQYDTPAAIYLVYQSKEGTALGVSRLTPVCHSCMIKDLWPEMVDDKRVFSSTHVWEATRFCIDHNLSPANRKIIKHEIVLAYLEFGLHYGVRKIIGLMLNLILKTVFKASGVLYDPLGPVRIIDGHLTQAASMAIDKEQLARVRRVAGINHNVIWKESISDRLLVA